MKGKTIKGTDVTDCINYDPYPDCDPSCWELEYIDWDELDSIMFIDEL